MGAAMSPGKRKYACSEWGTRRSMVRAAAIRACPTTWPPKTLRPPRSVDWPRKRFTSSCSRSSWRMRPVRVGSMPTSMSERFVEPPGTVGGDDLRVDDEGTIARATEPVADGGQIASRAHDRARATEAACDGREIRVRELHRLERETVGPEVMHLGAIGLVVVYDDDEREAQPDRGEKLRDRHREPAVAQRRHSEPIRTSDRRSARAREAEPDSLDRLGEDEPMDVRHGEEHRRVAHEVAGIDHHGARGGEEIVERDGQGPRVDPIRGALVRIGDAAPRSIGGGPRPPIRGAPSRRGGPGKSPRAGSRDGGDVPAD